MIRVAIVSHKCYKDWPYLQNQLNRLASLYHEVVIIHGGETVPYGQFLTQWCKEHDEFTEIVCPKDVFKYGFGPAAVEQANAMLDANPDEFWKFETSPGSNHRPSQAVYPEVWQMAANEGITLRVFRKPFRKSKYTGKLYEQEMDANGFPKPIKAREWDGERNGLRSRSSAVQRYSNKPADIRQRNRRRAGEGNHPW